MLTRKSALKWIIIFFVIIALAGIAYTQFVSTEETPNYITATAEIKDIENNVMASGKVKALNTVAVGAQVSGEVTKLYVKVGDEVKKGDLIAQIDQVTQQNNLSNQQATLEQSYASLQSAQAEYQSRIASLNSAQADLASREAELRQAIVSFERLKPLIEINAISQQEFENAQTKVNTAQAAVANAQAAIGNAQAAIITAESNIVRERATLQKAQTDLNTANENLGYTTIRAPIDGTVVSVTTEQGATVNSNQSAPTIVTLADLSTVRINAQISEADILNVKAGMPVYFHTIGNPDQQYDAVLTTIEPAPEKISTSSATDSAVYYIGSVEVPNPDRRFRIDMTAQIFIIIDQAKNVLTIPSAAIVQSDTGTHVRVLSADGEVIQKPVTIGINNRVNAQVLSGLQAGETVILSEDSKNPPSQDMLY
ncbi:efflux RND transporter periplasmic adaptor subunit [Psychrobacter sp. I-STPA6b]|uniref:efflux RND transporter periplasmic adaptor subunit n=1 Tax=Psychrobacter sp. I-STPA6b TaxID=2585718 RepID=UPI001D0C590A|nr:efflux RND transporter periplasmic adaptor subunit [Psychrobacter sp. I-STPA6b]